MYEKELTLLSCIHQVCKNKKIVANTKRFEIYDFTTRDLVKIANLSKFKIFGNKIGDCSICKCWFKAIINQVDDTTIAQISSSIPFYYNTTEMYSIYHALLLLTKHEDKKIRYSQIGNELIFDLNFNIASQEILKDYYVFKKKSYIEIPNIKVRYNISGNEETTIVQLR